jgi:hypothetical protein
MKGRSLAIMLSLVVATGLWADGRFTGSDLYNEDDSLDVHTGKDGIIDFIKATFYPGPGFLESYSYDVADNPAYIHGLGVVTKDRIRQKGPNSWVVTGYDVFPVEVALEGKAISLRLGRELYRVSHPKDYLVEVWPLGPDGKPDLSRRLAYAIAKNSPNGFLGITDRGYVSSYRRPLASDLDPASIYIPQEISFDDGRLESYVYAVGGDGHTDMSFTCKFDFSRDKSVNLVNYLILLTQRRGDLKDFPVVHSVILTLFFYDALMP